jgi:porin
VGGVAGHALLPGLPLDDFGVGYFFYDFSDVLQNALAPGGRFNDEQGIEAYYTFVPAPWLRLSANLQWVKPARGPDGHPNSSTCGHPKLLHPERGVTMG